MKVFEEVAKKARASAFPAPMRSVSTTRMDFRSTSPPTSRASADSKSTWPVSKRRWKRSANARVRRASSRARACLPAELASDADADEVPRLRHARCRQLLNCIAIVRDGRALNALNDGDEAIADSRPTPFYAESGGQVGDAGVLTARTAHFAVSGHDQARAACSTATSDAGRGGALRGRRGARGAVDARAPSGDRAESLGDASPARGAASGARRRMCSRKARWSRRIVCVSTSRISSRSRPDELRRIEDLVNAEIRRNVEAEVREMAYQDALDFGALALFGEKYGDEVRVLQMGAFSTELCGGTHVARTGDIGLFKIVSESGVAAGVRRIEALTGAGAVAFVADEEARLDEIGDLLSTSGADVVDKLRQMFDRQKKLERELESLKAKAASSATHDLAAQAQEVAGFRVIAARVDGLDAKALREGVDGLKQKLVDCVVLLASASDGKVSLAGGVHGSALAKIKAGDVVAHVAAQIGGKGGGRADMAQGGGADSPALDSALAALPAWIAARAA